MSRNKVTIRKVPLNKLLTLLNDLYANGADYVDIHGEKDLQNAQDKITVSVPISYMSEDINDYKGVDKMEEDDNSKLTEDEIDDLLDNV